MTDIRLKTTPFEFDGKTFQLCCNMNVLADVQEAYGGSIYNALDGTTKGLLHFLAAMLNDYAEASGWEERYTFRDVGRALSPSKLADISAMVMGLVTDSLKGDNTPEAAQIKSVGETGKNLPATRRKKRKKKKKTPA